MIGGLKLALQATVLGAVLGAAVVVGPTALPAQGAAATAPERAAARPAGDSASQAAEGAHAPARESEKDFIAPHIRDSHHLDVPCLSREHGFVCELDLPRWTPIHIAGITFDLSPTKHVVMVWIAGILTALVLLLAARGVKRAQAEGRPPKGFANAIEAMVLYIRNDVILPNVGPHGERYLPFCQTIFWMVLALNLLGLVPYGAAASGNISVTATLAILTFIVVEIAGIRTLGKGYIATVVYWPHDMPLVLKSFMTVIMTPVELASKFTKPFALAIRLFANMVAGHVVVLALIGLTFTFSSVLVGIGASTVATSMMIMELFVAFLQAFIFCLLSAVFIGLIRETAH